MAGAIKLETFYVQHFARNWSGAQTRTLVRARLMLLGLIVLISNSALAILGGEEVTSSEFQNIPVVAVMHGHYDDPSELLVCSGVLLNSRTVLTAAHCVQEPVVYVVRHRDARSLHARHRIDQNQIRIHPAHNATRKFFDFAIIQLEREIQGFESIRYPVFTSSPSPIKSNDLIKLYGYGIDHWKRDGILRTTTKMKKDLITYQDPLDNQHFIQFNQADGFGICEGDSGGPALLEYGNQFILLGLHTFATNLKGKPVCSLSGTSSMVGLIRDWLSLYVPIDAMMISILPDLLMAPQPLHHGLSLPSPSQNSEFEITD